jgi:hypothetical protein
MCKLRGDQLQGAVPAVPTPEDLPPEGQPSDDDLAVCTGSDI